jgi:hypothetical protein
MFPAADAVCCHSTGSLALVKNEIGYHRHSQLSAIRCHAMQVVRSIANFWLNGMSLGSASTDVWRSWQSVPLLFEQHLLRSNRPSVMQHTLHLARLRDARSSHTALLEQGACIALQARRGRHHQQWSCEVITLRIGHTQAHSGRIPRSMLQKCVTTGRRLQCSGRSGCH